MLELYDDRAEMAGMEAGHARGITCSIYQLKLRQTEGGLPEGLCPRSNQWGVRARDEYILGGIDVTLAERDLDTN
jgi:hypothetical protein